VYDWWIGILWKNALWGGVKPAEKRFCSFRIRGSHISLLSVTLWFVTVRRRGG
jgi:hypothetical protein